MYIKNDDVLGIVSITPDCKTVQSTFSRLTPGRHLDYKGREGGVRPGGPISERTKLFFSYKGKRLFIVATSDEDELNLRGLRDSLFFSSGQLEFIRKTPEGSFEFCVERCQLCASPLIVRGRCEWRTCNSCADKCEHSYVDGHVHGGDVGLFGVGKFCEKCGRTKPGEQSTVLVPWDHEGHAFVAFQI